jgi:hypothetical protein
LGVPVPVEGASNVVSKVVLGAVGFVALIGALVIALASGSDVFAGGMRIRAVTFAASSNVETQLPQGVVAPEECRVDPRPVDELLETIHAAYSSAPPTVEASGSVTIGSFDEGISVTVAGKPWIVDGNVVVEVPGPVAVDSTASAISALLRERVACQNAGDAPRFFALHSDAWIAGYLALAAEPGPNGKPQVPEEGWELLLTGPLYHVDSSDWRAAPDIVGVWKLPDGRVAAIIVPGLRFREIHVSDWRDPPELFIFSNVDGKWLVDYFHTIRNTTLSPATPQSTANLQ